MRGLGGKDSVEKTLTTVATNGIWITELHFLFDGSFKLSLKLVIQIKLC